MNNRSGLVEPDFGRQSGIIASDLLARQHINVIGAGGIGSPTVWLLAKMGIGSLEVWDGDKIEAHNLPNQFYRLEDFDEYKVLALQRIVEAFTGQKIKTHRRRYRATKLSGLVVSAVDSMKVRQEIWQALKLNPNVPVYIDGRMGGEVFTVYTVKPHDPDDIRFYEANLFPDAEMEQGVCTARAIMYNTMTIAAIIASQIKKFLKGEEYNREIIFDLATLSMITR